MNWRGTNASPANLLFVFVATSLDKLRVALHHFLGVPEHDRSVLHATGNDACVIYAVNPVKSDEFGGGDGAAHLLQSSVNVVTVQAQE